MTMFDGLERKSPLACSQRVRPVSCPRRKCVTMTTRQLPGTSVCFRPPDSIKPALLFLQRCISLLHWNIFPFLKFSHEDFHRAAIQLFLPLAIVRFWEHIFESW